MSRNYSLSNVYVEKHHVETFKTFQILNYGMSNLVIRYRILYVYKRMTVLGGCCIYFFLYTFCLGTIVCCHDAFIFIYYIPDSCS